MENLKKLLERQLTSFEKVELALREYGEEEKNACKERLQKRYNREEVPVRKKYVEAIAEHAGVSRATVQKVVKILKADMPEILLQHLRQGGVSIENAIHYMNLPANMKNTALTALLEKPIRKKSYPKTEVHKTMNAHIMKYRETVIRLSERKHDTKQEFVFDSFENDADPDNTGKRNMRCDICLSTDEYHRMRLQTVVGTKTICICPDCAHMMIEQAYGAMYATR